MNYDRARQLIELEYEKLHSVEKCSVSQIYYNLIMTKNRSECNDYIQSDYVDAKNYIIALFDENENKDFGYDIIPETSLISIINLFPNVERVPLCKLAIRKATEQGLQLKHVDKLYYNSYKNELIKNRELLSYLSLILGRNIWIMLGCYLLFVVVISLMLLPAPFKWMEILDSNLIQLSPTPIWNYLANALIWLFGINYPNFCVKPIGFIGLIIYCIGKIFAFLFIGNFLFQKLYSYILSTNE